MKSTKKISILGCGWIGQALSQQLTPHYHVYCLGKDICANDKAKGYVCDVLVIGIPPRGNHLEVLVQTLEKIDSSTQVIFLSSISFYDGKSSIVESENTIQTLHENAVILRLGGLMGYDRIAGKYTAGKVLTADSRTNYIHRDDVVGIIISLIQHEVINEVFDAVAPIQSTKQTIFSQNAKKFGFKKTEFLGGDEVGKRLSPTKICNTLGYIFRKKDVHEFWDT
ncbi:MAG TPA: hypothetical protein ENK39_09975 [Epsilonproteobacteria bacterium]|nr:hypothetical protein [Campylobacterota bacterium]